MKKSLILLFIFTIIFLVSCGTNDSGLEPTDSKPEENSYLLYESGEIFDLKGANVNSDPGYLEFSRKIQLFSAKLSVALYQDSKKDENMAVSPLSIYMALAMAVGSGSGVAKDEVLAAIGVTEEEVLKYTKYIYAYLKNEKFRYDDEKGEKVLTSILDLNNSIWINEGVELKDDGLKRLANDFNADSFYAPFFSDNEKANAMLNNYVLDKTRGLINPKLELANEMYFALVNVLYLKDIWNGDDSKLSYTNKEYDFITYSGEVVKQALLKTEYIDGKAYETESFSHFYVMTDAGYRLKFILPKDGYTVDEVFTVDTIMNVNNITDYNRLDEENGYSNLTRVMFPKFEASYKNDIDAVLKNTFGIRSFYNNGQHMLGLTDENLRLERINHQAKLIVDEKGIEGAAVTVLETAPESALDGNFYDFIVNRAFAYLLTDKDGNILFSGVVNKI